MKAQIIGSNVKGITYELVTVDGYKFIYTYTENDGQQILSHVAKLD
jgi:hypothetical protein